MAKGGGARDVGGGGELPRPISARDDSTAGAAATAGLERCSVRFDPRASGFSTPTGSACYTCYNLACGVYYLRSVTSHGPQKSAR